MKQWNIKTPLVFRLSVILLCALIVTSNMVGDLYARYTASAMGISTARVAKISYEITPQSSSSTHQLNMNDLPDDCKIVAVDECFTLKNNGEVAYNYTINLSITYPNGQALSGYSLTTPANTVWLVSERREAPVASLTTPTITGQLGIGEVVTCLFYYFVDFDKANLDQEIVINYDIRCEQID